MVSDPSYAAIINGNCINDVFIAWVYNGFWVVDSWIWFTKEGNYRNLEWWWTRAYPECSSWKLLTFSSSFGSSVIGKNPTAIPLPCPWYKVDGYYAYQLLGMRPRQADEKRTVTQGLRVKFRQPVWFSVSSFRPRKYHDSPWSSSQLVYGQLYRSLMKPLPSVVREDEGCQSDGH